MELEERINRYIKASGTPPTRFGRDAVRDPRLVHDMRLGRLLGRAISRRLDAYLSERGA